MPFHCVGGLSRAALEEQIYPGRREKREKDEADFQKWLDSLVETSKLVCNITGNACGTDTWMEGCSCPCVNCQKYLEARGIPKVSLT